MCPRILASSHLRILATAQWGEMTMMNPQHELTQWRTLILEDAKAAQRGLDQLAREQHERFVVLCRRLAQDAAPLVKRIALRKLGQRGDRDDESAEAAALEILHTPSLRSLQNTALFALGTVGTARAFPILWRYAQAGSPFALASASKQVRTAAQRAQILALARQFITAPRGLGSHLRGESLEVLLRHSTVLREREVLLAAARLLTDENVIIALGDVDADVETRGAIATELRAIRASYLDDSAEYELFSHALQRLSSEQRTALH